MSPPDCHVGWNSHLETDTRLQLVPQLAVPDSDWEVLDAALCRERWSRTVPAGAAFICQAEWRTGLQPSRLVYWELYLDSASGHWQLWRSTCTDELELAPECQPRPGWSAAPQEDIWVYVWRSEPVAACAKEALSAHDAATLLLRYAWQQEFKEGCAVAPTVYDSVALLGLNELRELQRQVWG